MFKLDQKLSRIHNGQYKRGDFIIADAKDPDMGPSLAGCGPKREEDGSSTRFVTRAEFLENIAAIVKQDIVDIMLTSVSNLEALVEKGVFANSAVKPAIRANDTTDIWVGRGGTYSKKPSRPFRTASLAHTKPYTDLGLYSMTFNNDLDHDYDSLDHFAVFREDAADNEFKYFLEVFNPNVDCHIDPAVVPHYVNDCIVRCLAGLTRAERPQFLKIPFNGPKALDELASFDPGIVVGVLGGGAGTTRDCFELINQAEKYGARVALFGRKINLAEDPLAMVSFMREVASGNIQPLDAVKAYHAGLQKNGLTPARSLAADSEITEKVLMAG
jgi:hypothetical protein